MTTSAQPDTAAAGGISGPLCPGDLAALLRAAASVCGAGVEGRTHDLQTAAYTVRDRIAFSGAFPELADLGLSDDGTFVGARTQAAAALCRAVYGRVQGDPLTAALRWQRSLGGESAVMLGQMLRTAAEQVALEAAAARAEALLTP